MMIETIAVPDTYASGLGQIEVLNDGIWRFTFFAEYMSSRGEIERIIVARLLMSGAPVMDAIQKTLQKVHFKTDDHVLATRTH